MCWQIFIYKLVIYYNNVSILCKKIWYKVNSNVLISNLFIFGNIALYKKVIILMSVCVDNNKIID